MEIIFIIIKNWDLLDLTTNDNDLCKIAKVLLFSHNLT